MFNLHVILIKLGLIQIWSYYDSIYRYFRIQCIYISGGLQGIQVLVYQTGSLDMPG